MDHPEQPKPDQANPPPAAPAVPSAFAKMKAELLAQQLRSEVRKRRPQVAGWIMLLLLLLAVPLGLLTWWVFPRSEPPRLAVIAFDQLIGTASGPHELVAQLVPIEESAASPGLSGYEVYFQERTLPGLPSAGSPPVRAVSDADGRIAAPWAVERPDGILYVTARHAIPRPRHSTEDTARLFVAPKGTRYFVVEVGALTAAPNPRWGGIRGQDLKVREGAARALARVAKGNQVVYLALDLDRPEEYRAVRGWVQYQATTAKPALPDGPVLCRFGYGAKVSAAEARTRFLKGLETTDANRQRSIFIATDVSAAAEYARLSQTYLLGGSAPSPPGVTRLASWDDLK